MRGLSVTAQISAQNQPITVQPKKKLSRKIASALWPRAMAMIAGKKNIAVRMVSSIIVSSSAANNLCLPRHCRKVMGVVNRKRRAQEHGHDGFWRSPRKALRECAGRAVDARLGGDVHFDDVADQISGRRLLTRAANILPPSRRHDRAAAAHSARS